MKVVLVVLLILHGLIHLLGFFKGFQLAKVEQLQLPISKMMGLFWLLTTLLFTITLMGLIFKKEFWTYFALIAMLFSQVLIVLHWQDAKFGTLANLLILLLTIPALGKQQFEKQMIKEKTALLLGIEITCQDTLTLESTNGLPSVVQNWLIASGAVGKPKAHSVRLKQSGQLKTKPESKWMPFQAVQYVAVDKAAFIWTTQVDAFPGVSLTGRDRLVDGTGEMLIKLASLLPVVNETDNKPVNTGAMLRFLGEICWFPSAAVNDYITWEEIDNHKAKATFTWNDQSVSGVFQFTESGEIDSFEALRYFGGSNDAEMFTWKIRANRYQVFDGIKVPADCSVTWSLPEGDFEWLQLIINDMEYNSVEMY